MNALSFRKHGRALFFVWGFKLAAGLVLAYPLSRLMVDIGVGRFPDGDRLLFAPGGMHLLETLRLGRSTLSGSLTAALLIGASAAFLGLVPLAYLMVSLDERASGVSRVSRTAAVLPGFAFLSGLTVLVQGVLALATASVVVAAREAALGSLDERAADGVGALIGATGVAAIFLAGILEDLARADVVWRNCPGLRAVAPAFDTLLRAPGAVLGRWGVRALATLGVVFLSGLAVTALHVERTGSLRIMLAWVAHQAAIVAWIVLRAGWLLEALRLTEPELGLPGAASLAGTAEGIGAPDDPIRHPDA